MLIEDRSSSIEVVQGESRTHRLVKERSLLGGKGVKDLRVGSVFLSAAKITKTLSTLEEANGVVLEEHSIHQEVDGDHISITVSPDWNLKGHTLLNIKVRNELLQERRADRLGPGAELNGILAIRDGDIDRYLSGARLISGMIVVAFVAAPSVRSGLSVVNKFIEIGAGRF